MTQSTQNSAPITINNLWRTSALGLLLLLIPLISWMTQWQWRGDTPYTPFDYILYLLTESGSAPYLALITSFLLATLLSLLVRKHLHWLMVFGIVFLLHGSTQVIKSGIKFLSQEPRPYMGYLVEVEPNLLHNFYTESRAERKAQIHSLFTSQPALSNETPSWLQKHWANETGYSFPSGHTIFSAAWLYLFLALYRLYPTPVFKWCSGIVALWATLMLISRLRLGMHAPIDLFVSTVIAYLLTTPIVWLILKSAPKRLFGIQLIQPIDVNKEEIK